MKHALKIPFLLAVMLLAGCAALGIPTPETFNQRAAAAHQTVNSVVAATTNSLNSSAIKSDDAEYVRDAAVRTNTFLAAAETAYGAGDTSTAEGRLALAEGILRQLQTYVRPK